MKKMIFCIIPLVMVLMGCAGGAKPAAQQESPAVVAQTSNNSPGPGNNVGTVTVTTFAGSGEKGYADGIGTEAKFNEPGKVAVDGMGNVYVGDSPCIRKITPAGVVTTLAGSTEGYADGTGVGAQFDWITGMAVDGTGNLYVTANYRIRKITPAGVVTTLAGSGEKAYADGTGMKAKLSGRGAAIDSAGNIYVGDPFSQRIRKITPAGVVTTIAGSGEVGYADGAVKGGYADGLGAEAKFAGPRGVAVDRADNVYVADSGNERIRKITPEGVVTTLAGSGETGYADGTGAEAKFHAPYDVAVDSVGNVYVADQGNHRIRKITPTLQGGVVTTLAGSGDWGNGFGNGGYADGTGAEARFNNPGGVAVDSTGNVYVVDGNNHRIRKITIITP